MFTIQNNVPCISARNIHSIGKILICGIFQFFRVFLCRLLFGLFDGVLAQSIRSLCSFFLCCSVGDAYFCYLGISDFRHLDTTFIRIASVTYCCIFRSCAIFVAGILSRRTISGVLSVFISGYCRSRCLWFNNLRFFTLSCVLRLVRLFCCHSRLCCCS